MFDVGSPPTSTVADMPVQVLDEYEVAALEHAVLQRAVDDIGEWITQLPAGPSAAEWRAAFLQARRALASAAEIDLLAAAQS